MIGVVLACLILLWVFSHRMLIGSNDTTGETGNTAEIIPATKKVRQHQSTVAHNSKAPERDTEDAAAGAAEANTPGSTDDSPEVEEQPTAVTDSSKGKRRSSKPEGDDTSTSRRSGQRRQRWVMDLFEPWLKQEGEGGSLGGMTEEAFCDTQVSRVWELAEVRLPKSLVRALKDHRAMHEAVARGKPRPGQKYLVWSLSGGVGNRFLAMASTYLTAVLSGRVFLMKDWFAPLPKAGTKQSAVFLHAPQSLGGYRLEELDILFDLTGNQSHSKRPSNKQLLCPWVPMMSLTDFRLLYPQHFVPPRESEVSDGPSRAGGGFGHKGRSHTQHVKVDIRHRHDKKLQHWNRLLCSPLQLRNTSSRVGEEGGGGGGDENDAADDSSVQFFKQDFVYIWTNQYYLPGLFSNPHFHQKLRHFFPDPSRGGTTVGGQPQFPGPYESIIRLLVIPSKPVTQQVVRFFHQSTEYAEKLLSKPSTDDGEATTTTTKKIKIRPFVAAHIRAFQVPSIQPLAQAFDDCLGRAKEQPTTVSEGGRRPFFLATMHKGVREHFVKRYGKKNVLTWSHASGESVQLTGQLSGDQAALADMILLSMAAKLYVSGGSTFGMFSAAFGGLAPTLITNSAKGTRTCIPATIEDRSVSEGQDTAPQPCFGSWFHYDRLSSRGDGLNCKLVLPLPDYTIRCKG